jgi:catechol 2,3-dioxygenase-like lactoylglutathione lyase family enzyme
LDIKFGHIEIFVKEPLKAKEFYTNILGFELITVQGEKFVWLKLGNNMILLRPGENKLQSPNYQAAGAGLVIYTGDVKKTSGELKSRGLEFKGTDGSDDCLTFTDYDGNWFQLANPDD